MQTPLPLLQNVKVASPCPAAWSGMESVDGDRVKYCGECKKNVYNLSAMTQAEAEGLLRKHEGHLCVRYYQRRDGTILTANCPVGAHAVRLMFMRRSVLTAALVLLYSAAMAIINYTPAGGGYTTGKMAMPSHEETKPVENSIIWPQREEPLKPLTGQVMLEHKPYHAKEKLLPEKYYSPHEDEAKPAEDK